jgi:nicotinate phosphoribosyltransferase
MRYSALLTDLYELTMLAGYFEADTHKTPATFDYFFRQNPFKGGYAIFAGLESLLDFLEEMRFTKDDLNYLKSLGMFSPEFLDFLADFRFKGKLIAPPEGTVVFANEPVITVEGTLAEAQFVETVLLNFINFQSLVATKASRIAYAADDATVLEFGLRRAQGPDGSLSQVRASYIGGIQSTSNVLAGKTFGIPVRGTHAHSWIMAFPDELTAFRKYADIFPDNCVLLVDTYDTLKSGMPNAIKVAKELRKKCHELMGIRIDSGDLAYMSRKARQMLDQAGFPEVKIIASNELDEYIIESIKNEDGKVDIYGVGTKLATCMGEGGGALGGVYKLVKIGDSPRMKVTSEVAKATLPERKKLLRAVAPKGTFIQDIICLNSEDIKPGDTVYNPKNPLQHVKVPGDAIIEEIRKPVMDKGKWVTPRVSLKEMANCASLELGRLPKGVRRFTNPHQYKVSISRALLELRDRLIEDRAGDLDNG